MHQFLGVYLIMGVLQIPKLCTYYSKGTRIFEIFNYILRDRFNEILSFFISIIMILQL